MVSECDLLRCGQIPLDPGLCQLKGPTAIGQALTNRFHKGFLTCGGGRRRFHPIELALALEMATGASCFSPLA
jgi:hypothetical protein